MLSITISMLLSFHNVLGSSVGDWSYDHQDKWSSNYCGTQYKTQSPIAITASQVNNECPSSNKLDWQLVKDVPKFTVSNHGNIHVKLSTSDGQGSNDAYGKLKNNFKDHYNSEHGDYCLDSLHIHWPSEHTIDNHRSKLEMHFVHFSCEYDTIEKAIAATDASDKYVLAVVGVLYEEGEANKFLQEITNKITSLQSYGSHIELTTDSNNGININDLVTFNDKTEYYHYRGSLTTPSCNPIVSWHILKDKMTVSTAQLAAFATILNQENTAIIQNYRDAQTNTNTIYSCSPN